MKRPPYLKEGDKVAIVATARKISHEEIQASLNILRSWGFEVVAGDTIGKAHHQFAGTEEDRITDLQKVLDDTSIRAVFCARGGYGTVRIVDHIDFSGFDKEPKWIIGYSDITVLHAHIQQCSGVESIHALMPVNFPGLQPHDPALHTLRKALRGEALSYEIKRDDISSIVPNKPGTASGILCGGNLSLIYSLLGSISDVNTEGKILFIEDLDEYLYHIDRMMMSLKRSGKLAALAGLVVGGMTDMKDNTVPFGKSAEEIIMEHTFAYDYPVALGFPAGHTKDNRALIFGRNLEMNVSEDRVSMVFEN